MLIKTRIPNFGMRPYSLPLATLETNEKCSLEAVNTQLNSLISAQCSGGLGNHGLEAPMLSWPCANIFQCTLRGSGYRFFH